MDWITSMQRAIEYIEDNITEEIDYSDIAKTAYISSFHFQRAFSILCNYTVGEYIRNRRLSLAGAELSMFDTKVIDIALKYGYETPESFTKAFSRFHGITPKAAREPGANLKSFSRLSIKLIMEGGDVMDYRIEKKPSFMAVGKVKEFSTEMNSNKKEIPMFWTDCYKDGTIDELITISGQTQKPITGNGLIGWCSSKNCPQEVNFEYAIGTETNADYNNCELTRITIPAYTWAIFKCVGTMPNAIQNMWTRIYSEFFPQSEYKVIEDIDFEYYPEGDNSKDSYISEIWIPVEKK